MGGVLSAQFRLGTVLTLGDAECRRAFLEARTPLEVLRNLEGSEGEHRAFLSFAPGDGSTAYDAWGIWGWTRSAPWAPFPTPVQLTQEPGRPDNVIRNLRPANISISMTSGGNLSERDYQNWLEGKRRPIRRARNQR